MIFRRLENIWIDWAANVVIIFYGVETGTVTDEAIFRFDGTCLGTGG
jgi:hypothetical protein